MKPQLCVALISLFFVSMGTCSIAAQEPAEEVSPIQKAIERLGDPSFHQRQQAVDDILESGMKAEKTLEENLRHPRLEVRLRVAELLSEIRRNDLQSRIDALLNYRADGNDLELPGWQKYVDLVGDTRISRQLFAEMLQEEYSMMQLADLADRDQLTAQLTEAARLQNTNTQPTVEIGTYATYVFLGCLNDSRESHVVSYIYTASHRPPVANALRDGEYVGTLHTLLETFMKDVGQQYVTLMLQLSVEFNLKSGTKFATQFLETSSTQSDYQTRIAIMCLAKFGDESHLPILERQFGDEREFRVYLNGKQRDAQIRDYALVACLFITGQPLQGYGLETYPDVDRSNITGSLNTGFLDEMDREPAFEKWTSFREIDKEKTDEAPAKDASQTAQDAIDSDDK